MAILGSNTKGAGTRAFSTGRLALSKFTLATPQTLQELHGWFGGGSGAVSAQLAIYSDSSGLPSTLLANTSPLALTGSDVELFQTGFTVSLSAADYWIGWYSATTPGTGYQTVTTGGGRLATAGPPLPSTYPTPGTAFNELYSCWAVVGSAAAPTADFTGTPLTGAWPLNVAFTDTSTGVPTSWAWTFGDGGTSTAQNPTHTYTAAGTYTVSLQATNATGSNTKTRTGYVTVANPSGTLTKIKWGNRLVVTDEGGGVIRVDFV